jgi:hypothetical protein
MRHFEWGVAREGYQWREAFVPYVPGSLLGSGPWSQQQLIFKQARFLTPGPTPEWRTYQPVETPELLETFANLELTENVIGTFVNTYGLLGVGEDVLFTDGTNAIGESFAMWEYQVLDLRHVLQVWAALQARDLETLQRWFHLEEVPTPATIWYQPEELLPPVIESPLVVKPHGPGEPLSTGIGKAHVITPYDRWATNIRFLYSASPYRSQLIREPAGGLDARGLAVTWLQSHINCHLADFTEATVRLLPGASAPLPLELEIVPKNLCGALWLHVAETLRQSEGYQQCPVCRHVFHVNAKARRASTTYCSTRCRVRAARQRQAQAAHAV